MPSLEVRTLQRRVLSDDVVEYLIDAIMNGEFPPGSKIIELQIARALGVSQSTIREALRELETRGFLQSQPFKGTFVRKFTVEGLKDYFRTRTELEVLSAKWALENKFQTMNLDEMKKCLQEMEKYVSEKDHVAFRKKDIGFHRNLVEGSGSPSLFSAWNALSHSYWAYFGLFFEQQQYNLQDQMEKHTSIYNIMLSGHLEELKKAIDIHYVDISFIIKVID